VPEDLACMTPDERREWDSLTAEPASVRQLRADPTHLFLRTNRRADEWQANLLRNDPHRALLLCCRQSGKSTVAAALALQVALFYNGALVLLLSPTLRQSGELFRDKVLSLYRALERPHRAVQRTQLTLALANGSRIISLPGEEGTIRGFSGVALLVIDEAARVEDDLYRAVRPMLAVSGGRLVALSTPFGRRGWFAQEWFGEGAWERICITAQQCPRITPEFLADERRALGADWYAQEYLCQFIEGGTAPLFPGDWLDRAATVARALTGQRRQAVAIGCDPGEGQANTAWAVVDHLGLIELLSLKTPDTATITGQTIALLRQYNVRPQRCLFDRGGGGQQHADRLRAQGYHVRTVAFGESVSPEPRHGISSLDERRDRRELRTVYRNRRAELYGTLRHLLDPAANPRGFGLPAEYTELRRQLGPIPLLYDGDGRMELPPKSKRDPNDSKPTLQDLIGCSPDEADALALAAWALTDQVRRPKAGAL
jgi:Terminase large subunit, T4likevirus-type, N-terminal